HQSTFDSNTAGTAGGAIDNAGGQLELDFCRLVNNSAPSGNAVVDSGTATTSPGNDWWGSNTNPTTVANLLVGPGIQTGPWLVLSIRANPTTLAANQTSAVTATFQFDDSMNPVDITRLTALSDLVVTCGATHGTVAPTTTTTDSSGTTEGSAAATYTASTTSTSDAVSATVDGQPASVNLTIDQPPLVQTNPHDVT